MTQMDAAIGGSPNWTRRASTSTNITDNSLSRFYHLLSGYWFIFWLMNGLDKFFNEPTFFGVTRDAKFVDYFASIGLPEPLALFSLYAVGIYEIALGVLFFIGLAFGRKFKTIVLIGLELGITLFALFSLGDILFGDRKELWEHGCYIGLTVLSYLVAQRHVSLNRTD